jgi:excisionase family DNA binding protein
MDTSQQPEVMTLDEVAKYLRMGQSTIYKLVNNGDLPAFKIGGSWRVQRELLQKWIEDNTMDMDRVTSN